MSYRISFQCGRVKLRWRSGFETEISSIRHRFVSRPVLDGRVRTGNPPNPEPPITSSARPLRIALVTETYPPEINGVATTLAQLVSGLRREGHLIELTRPRQDGVDPRWRIAGRRSEVAPGIDADPLLDAGEAFSERLTVGMPIPRYPGLRLGLPAGVLLERGWRRRRPDVVHIATEGPLGWSALSAARRLGLPVVSEFRTNFHTYSAHYGCGILRKWVLAYLRRFHNRCAVTMVPTQGLVRELQTSGFERLRVVARGVDSERFHPVRRCPSLRTSWGAGPDTPVVISVGRLAPEKNLELLVTSFERMRSVRPDALLVVVGDGPAREWLEERLPGAVFAGRRVGEDLARHYASADLLMFPSLSETFGNVTLEAMASGLAVLAFDYGAAGQAVVSGIHGWTVPFGDGAAFQQAAADALGNLEWVRRLGSQAREAAEGLSWSGIVRTVSAIYGGVATSSRDSARSAFLLGQAGTVR